MTLRICGVGSRSTPIQICKEMTKIGEWIRENNHLCTSGHADGADISFEIGARKRTIVYLPWVGFNDKHDMHGNPCVVGPDPRLDELVHKFHPNPDKLTRGPFALMRRNGCQVLGLNLDKPVDIVVCYRIKSGGTDQAIRIARHNNIPVWNMVYDQYNTATKIISQLELLDKKKKG